MIIASSLMPRKDNDNHRSDLVALRSLVSTCSLDVLELVLTRKRAYVYPIAMDGRSR